MFFPDLGTRSQIASGPRVRAVGWLAAEQPYMRGPLDEPLAAAIEVLAERGWMHVFARGCHTCEFCDGAEESRNILVPGDGVLYAAPAMVAHYMREHGYLPPAEFRDAVLGCPEPGSDAYFARLRVFRDDLGLSEAEFEESIVWTP